MSGGTRCNLTHATDNRGIVDAYGPPGRFLHSALAAFSVQDTLDFFEAEGVATKVEETGKIFPVSNKALDVLDALLRRLSAQRRRSGARRTPARPGAALAGASRLTTAAPGASAPAGHPDHRRPIVSRLRHDRRRLRLDRRASAIPSCRRGRPWCRSRSRPLGRRAARHHLARCRRSASSRTGRLLGPPRGSLLFAHFGLSGPVVLDVSRVVSGHPRPATLTSGTRFAAGLRRKPALDEFLRTETAGVGQEAAGRRCWPDRSAAPAGGRAAAAGRPGRRPQGRRPEPDRTAARLVARHQAAADCRSPGRWASRRPRSRPAASLSTRSIRGPCRASGCRACTSPENCSIWTAPSADTTSRPPGAPAGWPASPPRNKSFAELFPDIGV